MKCTQSPAGFDTHLTIGALTLQLVNMRQPFQFVYFQPTGDDFVVVAESPIINVDMMEPMQGHLAITGDVTEVRSSFILVVLIARFADASHLGYWSKCHWNCSVWHCFRNLHLDSHCCRSLHVHSRSDVRFFPCTVLVPIPW